MEKKDIIWLNNLKEKAWNNFLKEVLKDYKRNIFDKIFFNDRRKDLEKRKYIFIAGCVGGIFYYQKYLEDYRKRLAKKEKR